MYTQFKQHQVRNRHFFCIKLSPRAKFMHFGLKRLHFLPHVLDEDFVCELHGVVGGLVLVDVVGSPHRRLK